MDKALHLSVGNRYSIVTSVFFVPYIILGRDTLLAQNDCFSLHFS